MNALERARARAARNLETLGMRREIDRILGVSLREAPTALDKERLVIKWTLALRTSPDAPMLWPTQAWALEEASRYGCLVAPVGVGGGKTWIAALLPTVLDARQAVVLTKASLVASTAKAINGLSRWYRIDPSRIHVVSYDTISRSSGADTLRRLRPDLVIADEAHCLRRLESNRSRRALAYMIETECRFVPMSGTMTERSVRDYAHLYALGLHDYSPLPADSTIDVWAAVLDSQNNPGDRERQALRSLIPAHRPATVATLRDAFRRRVARTPGVISGEADTLGTGLEIYRWDDLQLSPQLTDALRDLQSLWELPGGVELVDTLEHTRHSRTLSLGFWMRLSPVPGTDPQALAEWREARRRWGGQIRWALSSWAATRPGFDSPGLLAQAGRERRLQGSTQQAWDAWDAIRDSIEWDRSVEWVDRSPVTDTIQRFTQHARDGRGVIWYRSSTALEPVFQSLGIPVYGRGSMQPPGSAGIVAVQADVHGEGWNAQYDFADALVLEPFASATMWDQTIGRFHRPGQPRDTVCVYVAGWTAPLRGALHTAIQNARYIESTEGRRTKLSRATII